MKPSSFGVKIFGWIEISIFAIAIVTLVHIDYYPIAMILFSPLVSVLGIFTLKLSPTARRLNLLLSPFIVFTYTFGIMMLFEALLFVIKSSIKLSLVHFFTLFSVTLIIHICFFTNAKIKKQFIGTNPGRSPK